jgi:epsilon-lactone hydrolase
MPTMKVAQLRNRTVITGSDDDLRKFADLVAEAKSVPVYGGSVDYHEIRKSGLDLANGPLVYAVPDDVEREWIEADGVTCCWFRREQDRDAPPVLYFHGGGYVGGCVEASRGIAANLAQHLNAPVLAVEYRQGPEDPYPAAVEDAKASYRWLAGRTSHPITIAGDSAGGALAIGTALESVRTGPRPARCAIAMSAWIDYSLTGYSWLAYRDKDLVSVALGQYLSQAILATPSRRMRRASSSRRSMARHRSWFRWAASKGHWTAPWLSSSAPGPPVSRPTSSV